MVKIRLIKFSSETVFICGLVLSTLFYTRLVLDYTLVPRFLLLTFSLITVLFWFLIRGKNLFKIEFNIILLTYFLYVIFNGSSLFWAQNTSEAIFESSKLVLGFGVFAIGSSFLSAKPRVIEKIGKASLVIFFISLIVAISQIFEVKKIDHESIYHITGISSHKNLFSSFLFLNLLFCLVFAIYFSKGWRVVFIIASLLNLSLIILLQTRAVWFGLFAGMAVFTILLISRVLLDLIFKKIPVNLLVISLVILTVVIFLFVFPSVIDKLMEMMPDTQQGTIFESSSGIERLTVWDKTFIIIRSHLPMGVGAGNWQIYFPNSTLSGLWRVEDLNVTFQRPHNDFLWILSETGIIGFSMFLVFIAGLIFYSVKTFTYIVELRHRLIYGLFISFVFGFMVLSFFDFPKERMEHTIWLNIVYAILYVKIKENLAIRPLFSLKFKRWVMIFPLLLVLFIAVIGYLRFRGEFNTKRIYVSRDKHDWENVKTACDNAFSFAYTIDPTSVPIYWYKGNADASLQKYKDALHDLLLAQNYHPYNRNVLNDLGSAYVMNGNAESAKVFYKEAARISPRFDDPKLNLVALYINDGNWSEAAFWEKSIKHESERRDYYRKLINKGK